MSPLLMLILSLAGGISKLLEASNNKSLASAGVDVELADEIATSVLQATAQVKGATIDWTDPNAVAQYVSSLPAFTPIPATPAPAPTPIVDPPTTPAS